MNFGDRGMILDMANTRVAELKKKGYKKAQLLDADSIRTIFLVVDDPLLYHKFAVAQNDMGISRKLALRKLFRPAAGLITGMTK
jgi:formate dehydrogenase iron-sulfur subunit